MSSADEELKVLIGFVTLVGLTVGSPSKFNDETVMTEIHINKYCRTLNCRMRW